MVENSELIREIEYDPFDDEGFKDFFFDRAWTIQYQYGVSDIYQRVVERSREILRAKDYPYGEGLQIFTCPVKARDSNCPLHPVLLTYCRFEDGDETFLVWSMDDLGLTNEHRRVIWYDFVKDDNLFYQF